jgi:hypothetical protein
MKFDFSRKSLETPQVLNLMKIVPVEAEFVHAEGRTDRHHEANGRFLKFC